MIVDLIIDKQFKLKWKVGIFFQLKCVFAELNTNIEKPLVLGYELPLIKKKVLFSFQRFVI